MLSPKKNKNKMNRQLWQSIGNNNYGEVSV